MFQTLGRVIKYLISEIAEILEIADIQIASLNIQIILIHCMWLLVSVRPTTVCPFLENRLDQIIPKLF